MSVISTTDDTTPYFGVFDAIGITQDAPSVGWNDSEVILSKCRLWFCMQSYSISTNDGDQNQVVSQT
jgi:hypothetical protein